MKILFTTQPGMGHFNPLTPIMHALEAAGHTTRVACAASFAPYVARAGLTPIVAGFDWLEHAPEIAFPEAADMTTLEREAFLVEIFADTTANQMAHDLLALFATWQPDLIVRDAFEYGGCIAGDVAGIPYAVVNMEFYVPNSIIQQSMASQFAYLRSAYGLRPHPALEMLDRHFYVSYVPPSYQFPEFILPKPHHILRPAMLDSATQHTPPTWLATLPERPTIYVSMGTTFNNIPDIFRMIIAGLAEEPVNVIITIGWGQDPQQYAPLPDNVYMEQYIPQALLMPYCDLVISHGGFTTTMISLAYGCPLIVIPLGGHMFLHAQRVQQLQVGELLKPPLHWLELMPDIVDNYTTGLVRALRQSQSLELSPDTIRTMVRTVLHEPRYQQATARLQAEILNLPGPESLVPLLEALVNSEAI